jgi:hypothetical protein
MTGDEIAAARRLAKTYAVEASAGDIIERLCDALEDALAERALVGYPDTTSPQWLEWLEYQTGQKVDVDD